MRLALPLGVYVPGQTLIHRVPAGWKVLLLIAFILGVAIWMRSPGLAILVNLVVALAYLLARIPLRTAWGQVAPVLPLLLILGLFQWWQRGWELALGATLGILATVAAAALVTLTTPVAALMAAFERALQPFERFGLPVENISLAMVMTIRLIPLQAETLYQVLDARKARGDSGSLVALAIPVVIMSIKRARALGEALLARGVGD